MAHPLWVKYFPENEELNQDKMEQQYLHLLDKSLFQVSQTTVYVNYNDLNVELKHQLKLQPAIYLNFLSYAYHKLMGGTSDHVAELQYRTRLLHFSDHIIQLKELKAEIVDQLVLVRGTVVKIENSKPIIQQMAFSCLVCGNIQKLVYSNNLEYKPPTACSAAGCKGKSFKAERSHAFTKTIDWHKIKLQEKLLEGAVGAGRVPRTVQVELSGDLADTVTPGNVISVTGIVKFARSFDEKTQTSHMNTLYIEANMVSKTITTSQQQTVQDSLSGTSHSYENKDVLDFDFRDYYAVREIAEVPDLLKLLVQSLCCGIYGHELVKLGLLLGLFGGRERFSDNESNIVSLRSNSHILIVGDPGLGKSQLLNAAVQAAPRGVYVCANTTTSSGLTVTLSRGADGAFALEAGALVLADQGACCIDEFDKLKDSDCLLEAMEQQSVHMAKAGVLCNLQARCSVLAAANPVAGHYNKGRTVAENLKMSGPLLSRFDLIFILLDKPDHEMDRFLSEHVMKMHAGSNDSGSVRSSITGVYAPQAVAKDSLLSRLRLCAGETMDTLSPALLRKYIAYARKYVHPRLSMESAAMLQDFYLELRDKHRSLDGTPITTRQLESLIRLAEARAKMELRETVTAQDADDVIQIMYFSFQITENRKATLFDGYEDAVGAIQIERSQMGTGSSRVKDGKRFIARLNDQRRETLNDLFTYDQLQRVARDLNIPNLNELIDSVNNQGFLIRKPNRVFKLCI